MSYTKKYYSFQGLVDNMTVYEEDINGANPGVEWMDEFGNLFRSIVVEFYPSLNNRTFTIKCFRFIKSLGRDKWNFDEEYLFVSDDNRYLNGLTGEDSSEGEPNAVKSAQFFIDNIGKNLYNVPLSLYKFFTDQIIKREGLND